MNMDKQHRLIIPQFVRDTMNVEESEYYFVFRGGNDFCLQKSRNGRVIGKVKIDKKGRFYIPSSVVDVFENRKVLIYADGKLNKVGISIYKEDA